MSEYVVVKVDDSVDGEDLAKALLEFKGVESVELDGECSADVLRAVGEELWKLENLLSLDCPLSRMRGKIEQFLAESLSHGPKYISPHRPDIGLVLDNATPETLARLKMATEQMKSVRFAEILT